jgi:hypothetical protein
MPERSKGVAKLKGVEAKALASTPFNCARTDDHASAR